MALLEKALRRERSYSTENTLWKELLVGDPPSTSRNQSEAYEKRVTSRKWSRTGLYLNPKPTAGLGLPILGHRLEQSEDNVEQVSCNKRPELQP